MADFNELINGEQPVLVDFFAEWCGPCKTMAPVLKEVASRVKDKAKIIKVDVDRNKAAAHQYNVSSVPTIMVFKRGKIVWRNSGVVHADKLLEILHSFS